MLGWNVGREPGKRQGTRLRRARHLLKREAAWFFFFLPACSWFALNTRDNAKLKVTQVINM